MQVSVERNKLENDASGDERALTPEIKGKHRITAELKRFEQETKFLEVVLSFLLLFFLNSLVNCQKFSHLS